MFPQILSRTLRASVRGRFLSLIVWSTGGRPRDISRNEQAFCNKTPPGPAVNCEGPRPAAIRGWRSQGDREASAAIPHVYRSQTRHLHQCPSPYFQAAISYALILAE